MGENLQQEFGPYTLEELIARGGMAEIYRATVTGIGGFEKTVAIKKILPHLAEDDEFIAMLADEARIIESLDHANIAQVFDLGEIDGSYYICMEYIHGIDLADIVEELARRDQRLPLSHIVHITASICAGLHSAHSKTDEQGNSLNIVHRDISLHNVLVSFAGEVKIIDFGVAKAADRDAETKMGVIKGKLLYMAPEQAKAEDLDGRADLFAAGLCAYKMLTGHLPFEGDNEFQVYNNVLSKDIPPPSQFRPEVPDELDRIVMKLLRRDPDERYQEGYAAKQDLDRLLHDVDPGYNVNRLSRYVEENFSHLLRQRNEGSGNSNPTRRAPHTPSQPAAETGSRGAGHLDGQSADRSNSDGAAVRQEVPANEKAVGNADKTVAATPDSMTGADQADAAPPGSGAGGVNSAGQRTATDSSSTGEFDVAPDAQPDQPARSEASDGSTPWVMWAIAALVVMIGGLVAYRQLGLGGAQADSKTPDNTATTGAVDSEDNASESSPGTADGSEPEADPSTVEISLDSTPSDAELKVQGEVVGRTPLDVSLPQSDDPLELELHKKGFQEQVFELTPREDLDETVELAAVDEGTTDGDDETSDGDDAAAEASSESGDEAATESAQNTAGSESTGQSPPETADSATGSSPADQPGGRPTTHTGDAKDDSTPEGSDDGPSADGPTDDGSDDAPPDDSGSVVLDGPQDNSQDDSAPSDDSQDGSAPSDDAQGDSDPDQDSAQGPEDDDSDSQSDEDIMDPFGDQ